MAKKTLLLCIDWQQIYINHPSTLPRDKKWFERNATNAAKLIMEARCADFTDVVYVVNTNLPEPDLRSSLCDSAGMQSSRLAEAFYKAGSLPDNEPIFYIKNGNKLNDPKFKSYLEKQGFERVFIFGISMWDCVPKTTIALLNTKDKNIETFLVLNASEPPENHPRAMVLRKGWLYRSQERFGLKIISAQRAQSLLAKQIEEINALPKKPFSIIVPKTVAMVQWVLKTLRL